MSLQDRIAKRLLTSHGRILTNKRTAGGWWTSVRDEVEERDRDVMDSQSTRVIFGDGLAKLSCEVAGDEKSQIVGLQKYASLPHDHGMIFPYDEPRKVMFHMGTVPFPIDIIFVGADGRVNKIESDIEPGARGHFGMSHVSAVIEANAGFCRQRGIEIGCEVTTGLEKQAQEVFDGFPRKDINPLMVPTNGTDPQDRFKGHDTPDNVLNDQPMDGAHWDSQMGYDPTKDLEEEDGVPAIRPSP